MLQRITQKIGTWFDEDSDSYLQQRIAKVSHEEKYVNLLIDENYSKQKIEYSAPQGQLLGLASEEVALTVLTFMVTSLVMPTLSTMSQAPCATLNSTKMVGVTTASACWLRTVTLIRNFPFLPQME